ncbi:hypothetical protein [Allosphingosinicella deserti]|uniref:Uncharacterized protein n=1 Tax=Allosphingosinicella deserti TaxID=2116704 RepID=A0A2P7QW76_9SPHN|nr:hypothetical protein [Sphingomonas deserti]PSJ42213.1 hypothetical protein C7I55_08245 [Sphingomonas deserti]
MIAGALLIVATAATTLTVKADREIALASREIRLADAFELGGLRTEQRARHAGRVIAALPAGRTSVALSAAALEALARRAGLAVAPQRDADRATIRFTFAPPRAAPPLCRIVRTPLAEGSVITAANTEEAACVSGRPLAAVRYDRHAHAVRAAGPLEAGAALGPILLSDGLAADSGDKLLLVSRVGPVEVQRAVVAIQAALPGSRMFVRADDGSIFDIPAPDTERK